MFTSYVKFTSDCWNIVKSLTGFTINIVCLGFPFIGACLAIMFWVLGTSLYLFYGCCLIAMKIIPVIALLIWDIILIVLYAVKCIIAKIRHADCPSPPQLSGVPQKKQKQTIEMSGEEFERFVAKRLANKGYHNIEFTPASGDYGVDILATNHGSVYAFQCKRYSGSVGVHAVQEVYSGSKKYKADKAVVITNSTYTPNAKELANDLGVSLWDLEMIDSIFCE